MAVRHRRCRSSKTVPVSGDVSLRHSGQPGVTPNGARSAGRKGCPRPPDSRRGRSNPGRVEGGSKWRCGAHLPPASIFDRRTRALQDIQDRRNHTSEVPRRSFGRSGGAGVRYLSEPVRACRHRLDQRDEVGPTGWDACQCRAAPRRLDLAVREGSIGAKDGVQRDPKVRTWDFFGDQARPPGSDRGAPPVPPADGTRALRSVSSQLMQRIDQRSRDRTRLRNEKVRGSNPRISTPPKRL